MKTIQSANASVDAPAYAQLQQQIHHALRAQHPEWIQPDGNCPTCDSYEARLAELLHSFSGHAVTRTGKQQAS